MVDNTKGWKQLVAVLMFRRVSPDLEALHPIRKVAPRGEFNFGVRFTRLQRFCASSSTPTSTSTSESSFLKPMTPYTLREVYHAVDTDDNSSSFLLCV